MEKFNAWKVMALMAVVLCVGCATPKPSNTGATTNDSNVTGTGDARSGAGTGSGGTETDSAGTGNATSGAGTGTGGTNK